MDNTEEETADPKLFFQGDPVDPTMSEPTLEDHANFNRRGFSIVPTNHPQDFDFVLYCLNIVGRGGGPFPITDPVDQLRFKFLVHPLVLRAGRASEVLGGTATNTEVVEAWLRESGEDWSFGDSPIGLGEESPPTPNSTSQPRDSGATTPPLAPPPGSSTSSSETPPSPPGPPPPRWHSRSPRR